jgi:glycosyltransferase involved in cell wall biosynthesis
MIAKNLITAASFMPDLLQSPSAWLGHLPFAGWVIQEIKPKIFVELGTHHGHSYFAFCQSVIEGGLSTRCYAVDTWQGDEHAGRYSDEIFAKVNAHNQEHYAGFSQLLRTTFDDAVSYFTDESIELLHIDGLHIYEAVRHDFENWLPKLAPGAIVMFHDTNVHERNFGVWKLWEELQARYPNNLQFMHSYGLGVLQLNNAADDKKLEWLQNGSPRKEEIINYFAALGSRQWERFELNELKQQVTILNQAVAERDGQIAELNQAVAERDGQIAELNQAVAERDGQIAELNQAVAERDGQIVVLHNSTSWQITRPLRLVAHQMKRVRRVAELALPAIKRGGGIKNTFRKALKLYQTDGMEGIKRGFRAIAALQAIPYPQDIDSAYHQMVTHSAEELLTPRVLIIAEMSIPQCKKYRVLQKKALFESLGIQCTAINWNDTQACLNALQTHSFVIFYRVPAFGSVISLINEAKRLCLPTLWEVDDFIFDKDILKNSKTLASLDQNIFHQLMEGAGLYRTAMLLCDEGIASTIGLAEAMKQAQLPVVHVIENALDQDTLVAAANARRDYIIHHEGIVRIVYGSGTKTHNIDFQEAATAIIRILEKFPNVRFRLIGALDLPEAFLRYEDQVERLPICTYEEYLKSLAECDISIAPLENYIFNDSKSNIKYLEASIVKIPSVCSPRAAFSQAISHGENGFLCQSDEEWEAALTLLVTDAAKRAEISEAAYLSVMRQYSPERIAQQQVKPLLARYHRNPNKLRILSVNCYYYPRSFGGATIVAEEVNKRINAMEGFEIHVFTALPSSVTPPYTIKRYEYDGINIYGVGLPDQLNEKMQFENPEIVDAFADVLDVVRPDIVHFHSIQGIGVSVIDICAKRDIKYVITLHDAWWLCGRQFMINRYGKYCEQKTVDLEVCATCVENNSLNLYRNKRLVAALHNAAALLAPSHFFANFHLANGFSNVKVNKNGIVKPGNTLRFRREGGLRLGYVGGNTDLKGVHLIKKVFCDLPSFDVKLVLVDNALNLGFASYHKQDLVGLPNVEIVPAYTQSTIDEFFNSIDVLLFPSQLKESFGLTVREALARNVWVITTDAGGAAEDIDSGANGYVVPFSDTGEALRQAVIDTLMHFERIKPGEKISLGAMNITFFEDQAAELASILKQIDANESAPTVHALQG